VTSVFGLNPLESISVVIFEAMVSIVVSSLCILYVYLYELEFREMRCIEVFFFEIKEKMVFYFFPFYLFTALKKQIKSNV
jgi:hypothetical protein